MTYFKGISPSLDATPVLIGLCNRQNKVGHCKCELMKRPSLTILPDSSREQRSIVLNILNGVYCLLKWIYQSFWLRNLIRPSHEKWTHFSGKGSTELIKIIYWDIMKMYSFIMRKDCQRVRIILICMIHTFSHCGHTYM